MVWVWARGVGGVVALLLGLLWILQGLNVIHGAGMSGHTQFAVLGAVATLFGVWLLAAVLRARLGATAR